MRNINKICLFLLFVHSVSATRRFCRHGQISRWLSDSYVIFPDGQCNWFICIYTKMHPNHNHNEFQVWPLTSHCSDSTTAGLRLGEALNYIKPETPTPFRWHQLVSESFKIFMPFNYIKNWKCIAFRFLLITFKTVWQNHKNYIRVLCHNLKHFLSWFHRKNKNYVIKSYAITYITYCFLYTWGKVRNSFLET